MWAKIITIKRTKDLNYFSLCALNLFNTRVSQFELNYWNKWTFSRHSRCTCIHLGLFRLVNSAWSVHSSLLIQTRLLFHWKKQYYVLWSCILAGSDCLKLKCLDGFVSYKQQFFISQDINWWTGVDYCDVLSAVWTHSDGTHSLQRIHWWARDTMLNFSKLFLIKKQTHLKWS